MYTTYFFSFYVEQCTPLHFEMIVWWLMILRSHHILTMPHSIKQQPSTMDRLQNIKLDWWLMDVIKKKEVIVVCLKWKKKKSNHSIFSKTKLFIKHSSKCFNQCCVKLILLDQSPSQGHMNSEYSLKWCFKWSFKLFCHSVMLSF